MGDEDRTALMLSFGIRGARGEMMTRAYGQELIGETVWVVNHVGRVKTPETST
jgi:hypothetical protein